MRKEFWIGSAGGGGGTSSWLQVQNSPADGCSGRDQANWIAGEAERGLRGWEQRGSHDVGGLSCIGKYQVPVRTQ